MNSADRNPREKKGLLASTAKIFYHQASHAQREQQTAGDCSAVGYERSGASPSFPQRPVRLRRANTKRACFGSGHCSLPRNRQTEKGALKEGTDRSEGAQRGPGKDERQLFLQSLHLRVPGASLHPAPPPLPAPQQLLRVYCSRERLL